MGLGQTAVPTRSTSAGEPGFSGETTTDVVTAAFVAVDAGGVFMLII